MEYSVSTFINYRWSLCIFASLLCFLFINFSHDQGLQLVTIVASFESLRPSNYTYLITNISMQATASQLLPLQNSSASPSELFPSQVLPLQNSSASLSGLSPSQVLPLENSSASPSELSPSQVLPLQKSSAAPSELSSKPVVQENFLSSMASVGKALQRNEVSSMSSSMITSEVKELKAEKCDIFNGKWVYDPKNYPLYNGHQCPFLSDQVSCQKNGRPDSSYEHWRWEPRNCEIPRFNGTDMLEKLRGKRMVIIGDSLNRNQWESLSCLLYSSIRPWRAKINYQGANKIFRALDYDFSLEFLWSPFLVKLEQMKNGSKVLKLNELTEHWRWRDADVLVFNTGHWWTHRGRTKTWDLYDNAGKIVEEMEGYSAFEKAMNSWAWWIDRIVNTTKTSVLFRSISPEHKPWNLHWCYNQSQLITNETSYKQSFPKTMVSIVEQTIKKMKTPVKYLNITRLSEHRPDAHTSVYTVRQGKLLTDNQRKQPELYADCSHWCLPGLPDTWNLLLYAYVVETSSKFL